MDRSVKQHGWFVRVDDRLLHGQVALNWISHLRPGRVAVVDETLAAQPQLWTLLEASLPANVELWVGGVSDVGRLLGNEVPAPGTTLVLVASIGGAAAIHEAGLRYATLNLGMLARSEGRVRVGRQLWLSRGELAELRRLADVGVWVSAQALPNDPPLPLEKIVCRIESVSSPRSA